MTRGKPRRSRKKKRQNFQALVRSRACGRLTRFDSDDDESKINSSATQEADVVKVSSYPRSIIPAPSKRQKDKKFYCRRLIRNLLHYEREPQVWSPEYMRPLPPILKLPAELRQRILGLVPDDNEVLYPRPNQMTRDLALTCKIIAADMKSATRWWDQREESARSARMMSPSIIEDFLRELRQSASNVTATNSIVASSAAQVSTAGAPEHDGSSEHDHSDEPSPAPPDSKADAIGLPRSPRLKKREERQQVKKQFLKLKSQKIEKQFLKLKLQKIKNRDHEQHRAWARKHVLKAKKAMEKKTT